MFSALKSCLRARGRLLPIPAGLEYVLLACLVVFSLLSSRLQFRGISTVQTLTWSLCSTEEGVGSKRHEQFLNKLDGRRVHFVGDSIIRNQYLELAHYLAHGKCIDAPIALGDIDDVLNTRHNKTVFDESHYDGANAFFYDSSPDLSVDNDAFFTREVCMGSRLRLQLSWADEQRVFVYKDKEGRKIVLAYSQYFDESIGRLRQALAAVDNFLPTDVVVNFGAVFDTFPTDTDCGLMRSEAAEVITPCPFMNGVCNHFMQNHTYNTFWQSTTPKREGNDKPVLTTRIGLGHALNPVSVCGLPERTVLDTEAMLKKLVPEGRLRPFLYTGDNALTTDAYHAFNWNLVHRLPPLT